MPSSSWQFACDPPAAVSSQTLGISPSYWTVCCNCHASILLPLYNYQENHACRIHVQIQQCLHTQVARSLQVEIIFNNDTITVYLTMLKYNTCKIQVEIIRLSLRHCFSSCLVMLSCITVTNCYVL
jgi:hypothetical protein